MIPIKKFYWVDIILVVNSTIYVVRTSYNIYYKPQSDARFDKVLMSFVSVSGYHDKLITVIGQLSAF